MTDVVADDRDAVRTITLHRPDSRNGLTGATCQQMAALVRTAPAAIRAIVVTGAGGAFCSGLDLKAALDEGPGPERERTLREDFQGLVRTLVASDRPTIAAVDGAAAGFGCDLALACDLRIASDRAVFGEVFAKRGLMPDGGGTWLLPRIVGLGRALELLLTGDSVGADEAYRIGLANRVVPEAELAAAAHAFAAKLAAGAPIVHRLVKQSVYEGLHGDLESALEREASGQLRLVTSSDFTEGLSAFLQKREPTFTGE
ncbi:MAG TPA: enoyl-CoA hydratase-related protein [Kofleriaceae bacterium]